MAAVLACGRRRGPQPPRGRGPPRPAPDRQRADQRHRDRRATSLPGIRCHFVRTLAPARTRAASTASPPPRLARTYLDLAELLSHAPPHRPPRGRPAPEQARRQRASTPSSPATPAATASRRCRPRSPSSPTSRRSCSQGSSGPFGHLVRDHHLPSRSSTSTSRASWSTWSGPSTGSSSRSTAASTTEASGPFGNDRRRDRMLLRARWTRRPLHRRPGGPGPRGRGRGAQRAAARRALAAAGEMRSVIVPSSSSAASAIVSDSVGCGWTLRAMSSALAPISSASTASEMRSPAPTPDDARAEQPLGLWLEEQLGHALVAAQAQGPARRAPREDRLLVLDAVGLGPGLGQAHPRHLGVGVGHRRDRAWRRTRRRARR